MFLKKATVEKVEIELEEETMDAVRKNRRVGELLDTAGARLIPLFPYRFHLVYIHGNRKGDDA